MLVSPVTSAGAVNVPPFKLMTPSAAVVASPLPSPTKTVFPVVKAAEPFKVTVPFAAADPTGQIRTDFNLGFWSGDAREIVKCDFRRRADVANVEQSSTLMSAVNICLAEKLGMARHRDRSGRSDAIAEMGVGDRIIRGGVQLGIAGHIQDGMRRMRPGIFRSFAGIHAEPNGFTAGKFGELGRTGSAQVQR